MKIWVRTGSANGPLPCTSPLIHSDNAGYHFCVVGEVASPEIVSLNPRNFFEDLPTRLNLKFESIIPEALLLKHSHAQEFSL